MDNKQANTRIKRQEKIFNSKLCKYLKINKPIMNTKNLFNAFCMFKNMKFKV